MLAVGTKLANRWRFTIGGYGQLSRIFDVYAGQTVIIFWHYCSSGKMANMVCAYSFFYAKGGEADFQVTVLSVGRAQNNLRKEDSGCGKAGSGRWLILLAAHKGHFLLWSEDVGTREFSGRVRAATSAAATNFTT
jgi:hypothetical protein